MAKKKSRPDIKVSSETIESKTKEVGRPTEYKESYCELLIDHMTQGLSFESFAGLVGVWKQTLYNWTEAHPAFMDAKRIGTEKSRLWWEKTGHAGMFMGGKDNPFNSTIWVFSMKNRFNWRDKVEYNEKPPKHMSDDELLSEAKKIIEEKEGKV